MPVLACVEGPLKGERFPLVDRLIIGRLEGTAIRLTGDDEVSRRHAAFRFVKGRWVVVDLESRNGTRKNGEPIARQAPLAPGDIVAVGRSSFRYEDEDAPSPEPEAAPGAETTGEAIVAEAPEPPPEPASRRAPPARPEPAPARASARQKASSKRSRPPKPEPAPAPPPPPADPAETRQVLEAVLFIALVVLVFLCASFGTQVVLRLFAAG